MGAISWLDEVRDLSADADKPASCDLHLFGSARNQVAPRDLDLLVVYDDDAMMEMRLYRARLEAVAVQKRLPALDFVTLTRSEERSTRFARRERAVLVEDAPRASA